MLPELGGNPGIQKGEQTMNKSFLTIAASLTVVATILSSAPTISDASTTAASNTYTATFHSAPEPKVVTPGGSTTAELPSVSDWGFNSHLFIVSHIPCFPTSEVELEAGVEADDWVPVLSFEVNEGWEVVEETLSDGILTTVYFYSTPIAAGGAVHPAV